MTTIESPVIPLQRAAEHDELHQKLSTLMVLHDAPTHYKEGEETRQYLDYKGHTEESYRNNYSETAADEVVPDWVDRDSSQKSGVLRQVRNLLLAETDISSEAPEQLDWGTRAVVLMDKAKGMPEGDERDTVLLASVVSSQFSSDIAEKADFVGRVYDAGLQGDVATACKESPLMLLLNEERAVSPAAYDDDPDMTYVHRVYHRLADFAEAFEADPEKITIYVENVQRLAKHREQVESMPSAKKLGKTLIEGYEQGEMPDQALEEQVVTVSLSGEKVQGSILDLYKVERFALQQVFIQEQMQDVLAGIESGSSALQEAIIARRPGPGSTLAPEDFMQDGITPRKVLEKRLARLESDTILSFDELSQRALGLFSLEGLDVSQRHHLTREQNVALRFEEVAGVIKAHTETAKYLDMQSYRTNWDTEAIASFALGMAEGDEFTIGSAARDGAATPDAARLMIQKIVQAAAENKELKASPEELRDLTHDNKRRLLALSTNQFSDFIKTDMDARRPEEDDDPDKGLKIVRGNDGKLKILNDFPLPTKEGADIYAAALLGCPALRVIHPNRAALKKLEATAAVGTSNYIDHALAAIINAAYERDIFSVDALEQETASLLAQQSANQLDTQLSPYTYTNSALV